MLREKKRRAASNQAKGYIPNGKAEQFIKLVGSNQSFVNMFVGANGTSKTATGANIVANICYGVQNKWFDYPLFQKFPYLKKGRIISDPTTIKEKIIPELKKWFPANESKRLPEANYVTAKEGKNFEAKFITNTGFEFDIMSSEQDTKEFESVDLGWVWMDEPIPEAIFNATVARGRRGMIMIWTYTPLMHSAWIKRWIDDKLDGIYAAMVEAEMEDNCITHGKRGVFEHKDIKRIADAFPEDERQARVFGRFGHLIGRVHKGFKRTIHLIKPFLITPRDFTTYMALDVHPRVPDHVLYLSVDRKGTKFLTGELLGEGMVRSLYDAMVDYEAAKHYRMEDRIIDPSAYNEDQHRKEKSVGSQLEDLGMHFIKGSKDLTAGIKRTNDALAYQTIQGEMVSAPELYIFNTLKVAIKQLDEYVWADYKGPSKDSRQPMGRPKDINDHQPENLHRLLLHEPTFIPMSLRQSQALQQSAQHEEDALDPYDH